METAAVAQHVETEVAGAASADERWARAAAWLFGAWMLARGVGAAFAPMLLVKAPLLPLILSPAWTNFILVSALVPHAIFVPVAMTATVLQAALGYQVGRMWGNKALLMFERKPDGVLARVRRMVERAAPLVVFLLPGPLVCTMAGIAGLRPAIFYPVIVVSKAMWITLCLTAGEALGDHIKAAAGVIRDNLLWISVIVACWVIGRYLWRRAQAAPAG